jgi:flagellin
MSIGSANTNTEAMVALRNLNSTQQMLSTTQNRISTGLKISSTKDDSAMYQIAQNLRSDIGGINAVRTSLDRAKSSLDVTVSAAESVSDLLIRARELAVNASDNGLDTNSRSAIAADFGKLMEQIDSVVDQSEFNGNNLVKASPDQISAINSVGSNSKISRLNVKGQDLTSNGLSATFESAATTIAIKEGTKLSTAASGRGGAQVGAATVAATNTGVTLDADSGKFTIDAATATSYVAATGKISIDIGGVSFTAQAEKGLTAGTFTLSMDDFSADGDDTMTVTAITQADKKTVGKLDLNKLADRSAALESIDSFATSTKNYLSTLGSASRQLDLQISFTSKLKESYQSGIGNLVDADLPEESARLQSLQVRQQLGVQSLSMANQTPQVLLSLFR